MTESWHTFGGRLRWAIARQPPQGRQRGLRLFQRRMEEHGANVPGTSLSAIQGYLRDDPAEPSPSFIALAGTLLSVRPAWLAWGHGAPTEEEEVARREAPEAELLRISNTVYAALGVPTRIPVGTPTLGEPEDIKEDQERFWGSAVWTPIVRHTALRLYQRRPSWDLLSLPPEAREQWKEPPPEDADARFWQAVQDLAEAIAAPLRMVGIDAAQLPLADVADYVQAVALDLQRLMDRYVPGGEPDPLGPLGRALIQPYIHGQEDTDGEA